MSVGYGRYSTVFMDVLMVNYNVKFEKYCGDMTDDSRITRTQTVI